MWGDALFLAPQDKSFRRMLSRGCLGGKNRAPASLLRTHCPAQRILMSRCSGVRSNLLALFAFLKKELKNFPWKSEIKSIIFAKKGT